LGVAFAGVTPLLPPACSSGFFFSGVASGLALAGPPIYFGPPTLEASFVFVQPMLLLDNKFVIYLYRLSCV
jgi:hypothetical protein